MQELLTQSWLIYAIQFWVIPWKGIALWLAARRGEKLWFVALLIFQTLGLLEIAYIFLVAKPRLDFLKKRKK